MRRCAPAPSDLREITDQLAHASGAISLCPDISSRRNSRHGKPGIEYECNECTVKSLFEVATLDGGRFRVSERIPGAFTMIVFYRGLHCPICKGYLR